MELEHLKVQTVHHISAEAFAQVGPEVITSELKLTLQAYVLSHRLAEYEVFYEVPANWWQHLRSQLGMEYQSKTKVIRVERFRSYPDSHVILPPNQFGEPVTFEVSTPWVLK